MPQSERHTRNKIVYHLMQIRKSDTISQEEMDEAIDRAGTDSDKSHLKYIALLEKAGTISRVEGGWTLAEECYRTGMITISVKPEAAMIAVEQAVTDAVRRFRPLATVAVEL